MLEAVSLGATQRRPRGQYRSEGRAGGVSSNILLLAKTAPAAAREPRWSAEGELRMAEFPETLREPVSRLVFLVERRPIRDDTVSVVVETYLSVLGPNLTILGGMEKGETLVDDDYQDRPDFWRLA